MCAYLAPRWRRRSLVLLALAVALAVMAVDAHTTDCGSGSEAVGDVLVGQVTTNATQSSTTVKTTAWIAGSTSDGSQSVERTVSFKSLVQTEESNGSERSVDASKASSASSTTDNEVLTPDVVSSSDSDSQAKETQQVDDDDGGSFHFEVEDSSDSADADSTSTSKPGDKTTGKTDITNKVTTPAPTPTQTAKPTPAPTPTSASKKEHQGPLRPGTFDARHKGSTSSSNQQTQSYEQSGSFTSAETLENQTKSAAATTSSRSLDQTLVVVIVGVVGAIGALLMFVSRKVLKETGDDKHLEDSSIF